MKIYNWGILGPGHIAQRAMSCFPYASKANVLAVASQTPGKAKKFAEVWNIPRYYETYQELVCDPDIDIVYVTTPNNFHCAHAMLAMNHGKHVLVEKPFAMNAQQACAMAKCAKENQVFLMEGMWTRFFPAVKKLKEVLDDGILGPVHNLQADFAYRMPYIPEHRMFSPAMGGGALMDVGIYSLSFASFIYNHPPLRAVGFANLGHEVDLRSNVALAFPEGTMASFFCSCDTNAPTECRIYGEKGWIVVPKFYAPSVFQVHLHGAAESQTYTFPVDGEGFQYEIMAVMACLDYGWTECPYITLDESIQLVSIMDKLRLDWGVCFPEDAV